MLGKIFINYRRGDDPGFTQALYLRLEDEFGADRIFMDVEGNIKPGDDFAKVLDAQVAASDVMLTVIGRRWSELLAERRADPDDFVAIEIKAALDADTRVIPVLVGGAEMPRPELLPASLRALSRRNAVVLRPDRFKTDCQGLVMALKEALAQVGVTPETMVAKRPQLPSSDTTASQWVTAGRGLPGGRNDLSWLDADIAPPVPPASATPAVKSRSVLRTAYFGAVGLAGGAITGALSTIVVSSILSPGCFMDSCLWEYMKMPIVIGAAVGMLAGAIKSRQSEGTAKPASGAPPPRGRDARADRSGR